MARTIDEAIAHARELAKNKRADADWRWTHGRLDSDDLINCAEEHEQLAEWLEELKEYKLKEFQCHLAREEGVTIGYEKAIDDFARKFTLEISESIIWGMLVDSHKDNSFQDTADKIVDYVIDTAKNIAEQLKESGKNGE